MYDNPACFWQLKFILFYLKKTTWQLLKLRLNIDGGTQYFLILWIKWYLLWALCLTIPVPPPETWVYFPSSSKGSCSHEKVPAISTSDSDSYKKTIIVIKQLLFRILFCNYSAFHCCIYSFTLIVFIYLYLLPGVSRKAPINIMYHHY